ncbi:hypothetical protein NOVO_03115 [Rickettsiales bacterium Ac37b]|nr:hypothetical protein NOVO_03115 [Rickettsiales bacterium Ac37b]
MVEEEVKVNEYKVKEQKDGHILTTRNLGADIAFTCFSSKLKKVAMARNINAAQIEELFNELNIKKLSDKSLIKIHIIGGDTSESSKKYVENLINQLDKIDNGRGIIDIIGKDVNESKHPDSIKIDCYHGGVNPHNPEIWKEGRLTFEEMVISKRQNSKNKDQCNII